MILDLRPTPASVSVARRAVGAALACWGDPDRVEIAVLLTSEVATNAIEHAGPFVDGEVLRLVLEVTDERVRVEVADRHPGLPLLGDRSSNDASGRGVVLIGALAASWGTIASDAGKVVWFEVSA